MIACLQNGLPENMDHRIRKKLVLTFDDGPDPVYTPQILDILSREHVPATFFLVGINAENNIPDRKTHLQRRS